MGIYRYISLSALVLTAAGSAIADDFGALLIAAPTEAESYLDLVERRIMAVWTLPEKSEGLKVVLRMHLERSGRVSDVRVEKSSGNETFDQSALLAVRHASPFPAVLEAAKSMVGDLRIVLDPTRPDRREEEALKSAPPPSPTKPQPRRSAPIKPAPKKPKGFEI